MTFKRKKFIFWQ